MKKIVVLTLVFLFLSSGFISVASAQNVEAEITKKSFDGENYIIKGHVALSKLNPEGQIPESDDAAIVMDVIEKDGEFPMLPESMYIRKPGKCETPYILNGKCLTNEEYYGKNCKTISLWSWHIRQEAWRAGAGTGPNGGFSYDAGKVQSKYDTDFEIKIPKEYADKTIRIRVDLTHSWGGPFASWPAFSFHHKVLYSGTLKNVISSGSKESPTEVMKKIHGILINTIKNLKNKKKEKDKIREDKGMHIFPDSKTKTLTEKQTQKKNETEQKIRDAAKKKKLKAITVKKPDGTEKTKTVADQKMGFWDKVKYYGSKFTGKISGQIPGVKYFSDKAEDWTFKKTGLDPIKKTRMDLGTDNLAANFYNKFNRFDAAEKKMSSLKTFTNAVGSTLAKPFSYVIDKLGLSTKQKTAAAYESEYKDFVKRIKSNSGNVSVAKKEAEEEEYYSFHITAKTGSNSEYKDIGKRLDYYAKIAKERGDLPK